MAAAIRRRRADVDFLIAGDGELRATLEAQAAALGLGEAVRFLGWRKDLATLYGATDLFVLTSRNEGTPVALMEAMATAVPGISTDVGGVRDVMTGPERGVLVPFGSGQALADAALSLLEAPERRHAMGAAARADVVARFGLDRLLDNTVALYDDLRAASAQRVRGENPSPVK